MKYAPALQVRRRGRAYSYFHIHFHIRKGAIRKESKQQSAKHFKDSVVRNTSLLIKCTHISLKILLQVSEICSRSVSSTPRPSAIPIFIHFHIRKNPIKKKANSNPQNKLKNSVVTLLL